MYGGGIYSDQKCAVCGGNLKDNFRDAVVCPDHPQMRAGKFRVHIQGVKKRFKTYEDSYGFLIARREEIKRGKFDRRDWAKDEPLGFANLVRKYIEIKKGQVRCIRNPTNHLGKASIFFGQRNIKDTSTFGELEDLLLFLSKKYETSSGKRLSQKSVHDHLATVHAFMVWCKKRRYIAEVPEFPEVKFELGWRKTVSKETQQAIIAEVKRISYHINPKIWIGIKWLATYVAIRPNELRHIKEGDIDVENRVVNIKYNKESKPKIVPFLAEDIELVRSFPSALPHLYFFRHGRRKGVARDKRGQFSRNYLWSWWRRACKNIKVRGVDLYGGTKHSSVKALREHFSPEQIKKYGTKHSTNAAFDRYFTYELQDSLDIYEVAAGGVKGKVIPIKEKEVEK